MSIFSDIVLFYLDNCMTKYFIIICFIVLSKMYVIVYVSTRIITSYESLYEMMFVVNNKCCLETNKKKYFKQKYIFDKHYFSSIIC